jgi:hypothetical protein
MTLVDRYRKLLLCPEVQALAGNQRVVEDLLWYGAPGSTEPPLLGEELALVRGRTEKRRSGERPLDLLVLCVGYSPEPLLLAVAHHAPAAVVLLVAEGLQDDYLLSLERLWDRHYELLAVPTFAHLERRIVRDTPADVFLLVRETAERWRRTPPARIVVDITGAKKSMIAGAFLAAGLLDLESSYVDFGEYDMVLRRPVPGTSQPGDLQHPYNLFRLREEARLAEEINHRRFREAERLAGTLAGMAASPEVASAVGREQAEGWARRFHTVRQVAAAYARWGEGFYAEAASEIAACQGIPVPPTVSQLGSVWPRSDNSQNHIVEALREHRVFADPATPLGYFLDVLVWNDETQIEARPRDVFLRLYGTIESVVFFVFHAFVSRRPERLQIAPESEVSETRLRELRDGAIKVCATSSTTALKVLRGAPGWAASPDLPCTVSLAAPAIPKEVYARVFKGAGGALKLGSFSTIRHKAVHWLAPVPKDAAMSLLKYYRSVLLELVPVVTAHLRTDAPELEMAARQRLDDWEARLLAAAAGTISEDCQPLSYERLTPRE